MAWLRHDLIADALEGADGRLLEVGCGQGAMGARLARRFSYVGVEPDPASATIARHRLERIPGAALEQRIIDQPGDGSFDVVCAFEVLEHIDDDLRALELWRSHLRPGGRLVLSVPAWQHRFGPADVHVGHFRRYEPSALRARLSDTGYEVGWIRTYGFPLGYALEFFRDLIAQRRDDHGTVAAASGGSGRFLQPPAWMAWIPWLVTLPFRGLQRLYMTGRLGTGLVALARRQD
ncbi:MAG: class I SAM-dependent methyltransferase [Nitriliruptorales bacterium]|nr:class I SAM-dependent methyltransferase [Nitriliruptorales bacterium]